MMMGFDALNPYTNAMYWDLKEVMGVLMRVLDGGEVSHEDLDDLGFEADGELEEALNEAYVQLREFANDRDLRLGDPKLDRDMRSDLRPCLNKDHQNLRPNVTYGLPQSIIECSATLEGVRRRISAGSSPKEKGGIRLRLTHPTKGKRH